MTAKFTNQFAFWLAYGLLTAIGLYGSLSTMLLIFYNEPDTSHTLLLWEGINQHGLNWLRDWLFTPDNWLLSLIPLHFIAFSIFGAKAQVVLVGGWVIMVGAALLCGLIARQLGANKVALGIPVVLLLLGAYAHALGFVSYSTSHNITNLFGLLALSLLLAWVRKPQILQLVALGLILTAGAVSDPWMLAAYNLPIALTALIFLHPRMAIVSRADVGKLLMAAAFSIIATKTRLFGILGFVPSLEFRLGDWDTINNNALYLIRDLGGLLNLVPFHTHNAFLPALFSLLAVTGLLGFQLWRAIGSAYFVPTRKTLIAFAGFCFFSLGGIVLAFTITAVPGEDLSTRFLINLVYLMPLALGILLEHNWPTLSKTAQWLALLITGLFIASGIISLLLTLANGSSNYEKRDVDGLRNYLEQNGLNYGYGSYWGSSANTITFESGGTTTIRPVTFNTISGKVMFGNRFQSSRLWYTREDAPSGQTTFFVIIAPDGEDCDDISLCKQGVTQQFGAPIKMLTYGKSSILVWDHPLIGYQPPLTPIPIRLGESINFNKQYNHNGSMHGWSVAENWGVWSEEDNATVLLQLLDSPGHGLMLQLKGHAFLAERHPSMEVDVTVNGQFLTSLHYDQQTNEGMRDITLPHTLLHDRNGQLHVQFHFRTPQSPAELGMSTDGRRLGLGLEAVKLTAMP